MAENFLCRVPADYLVASVRNPQQAATLAKQGIRVRAGDFAKPVELTTSSAGAEQVFVVSMDQLGEPGR